MLSAVIDSHVTAGALACRLLDWSEQTDSDTHAAADRPACSLIQFLLRHQ